MRVDGMRGDLDTHLQQASEYWQSGTPYEAGHLFFENLPKEMRPKWASRILRLVLARNGVQPSHFEWVRPKWATGFLKSVLSCIGVRSVLFQNVLLMADDHRQWKRGHLVFDKLRVSDLWLETKEEWMGLTERQKVLRQLLALAELVAKVTYNATDPPDPFDEDAGWHIAVYLRNFVDWFEDEAFSEAAWAVLCWRGE